MPESKDKLIARYHKAVLFKEPFQILYKIMRAVEANQLEHIQAAIKRESEIRLFSCILSWRFNNF